MDSRATCSQRAHERQCDKRLGAGCHQKRFPVTPRRLGFELDQFRMALQNKAIDSTEEDILPVGVGVICLGSLVEE